MTPKVAQTRQPSPRTPQALRRQSESSAGCAPPSRRRARAAALVLLLTGEPGIGKTRLMQELAREARDAAGGWRADAAGRRAARRRTGRGSRRSALSAATSNGSRRTPRDRSTHRRPASGCSTRWPGSSSTPRAQPLLIVLDDLHAADAASLVLLRFVSEAVDAGAGPGRRLLPRARGPVPRTAGAVRRARPSRPARVASRVGRRGRGGVLEGVTGHESSHSAAARLHVLTGGNPFFLGEVLRLVGARATAPRSIPSAPSRRRSGCFCAGGSRTFLPTRCAPCRWRPSWAASSSWACSSERAGSAWRDSSTSSPRPPTPGWSPRIPRVPRRYAFVHELVRETLYEDLASSRAPRTASHGRRRAGGALPERPRSPPVGDRSPSRRWRPRSAMSRRRSTIW